MPSPKTDDIMKQLENGVKDVFSSERYLQYLKFMSSFHNYSFRNTLLILMQNPEATMIAGYNDWKNKHNRQVLKGEKGLRILAPVPYKTKVDKPVLDEHGNAVIVDGKQLTEEVTINRLSFKPAYVFDISQTEGEPIPQLAPELNFQVKNYPELFAAISAISEYPITFENIPGAAHGYCDYSNTKIVIDTGMSEAQNIKTAIHEVAHSRLHTPENNNNQRTERTVAEVEAESVAYVVSNYFGIDTSDYSFDYIANWSSDFELKELSASLDRIQKEANIMIQGIEEQYKVLLKNRDVEINNAEKGVDRDMDGIEDSKDSSYSKSSLEPDFIIQDQASLIQEYFHIPMYLYGGGHAFSKEDWNNIKQYFDEPHVFIEWSESNKVPQQQMLTLSEANALFETADLATVEEYTERGVYGYDKTKFALFYTEGNAAKILVERQDFGDGEGSLIDHIRTFNPNLANVLEAHRHISELRELPNIDNTELLAIREKLNTQPQSPESLSDIIQELLDVTKAAQANAQLDTAKTSEADKAKFIEETIDSAVEKYKYKALPPDVSAENRALYKDNLPDWLKEDKNITHPVELYTPDGTLFATDFERIVIGDYGAFIEINPQNIVNENIKVQPGQEYRINDSHYANHIKYEWYTTKDNSNAKLYFQQRPVSYADYKVGMWYISPYECTPSITQHLDKDIKQDREPKQTANATLESIENLVSEHKEKIAHLDNERNTIVINAFAGPGAGKTTSCLEVCEKLKKAGYVAEYVQEYAKELVWDNNLELLNGSMENQFTVLQEQLRRVDRLYGKVDFIVTDSPILLNTEYLKEPSPEYSSAVQNLYGHFNNFNYFVERDVSKFETEGRIHNLEQSLEIDTNLKNNLQSMNIEFGRYTHSTIDNIVQNAIDYKLRSEQSFEKGRTKETRSRQRRSHTEPKYSKEENDRIIAEIKQSIPIQDYAQQLGYTVVRAGSYYTLKEHDSVRIDPRKNAFYRNSMGSKARGSIIDFVMHFEGLDRATAINKLASHIGADTKAFIHSELPKQQTNTRTEKPKELVLPQKADTMKNVFAYLINTRKIDSEIVKQWVKDGNLYQDTNKNCVFVTHDKSGKPNFVSQKGTNTLKPFQADVAGSDYNCCHFINNNAKTLIVCEAVIDLMSVQTILKANGRDLNNYNFLSLNGNTKTHAILNALQNSNTDTIVLATDNDKAGEIARLEIRELADKHDKNIQFIDYIPKNEKDWNAELVANVQREAAALSDSKQKLSDKISDCQSKADNQNKSLEHNKQQAISQKRNAPDIS